MSEYVYANTASQTIDIFLQDSSSSTGQGLAGLVFNSASLVASYRKGATGSRTAITLATQTVGGAFSSGGFVEIDATNMKGVYRLDIPNAAVDTEGFVTLYLYGATNLLPTALRVDCRPLPVDVKKFGGTAGTFASGIPEVKVASIAANAVNASALATDAVTEIQSGLATQTSVDDLPTNAELATALGTADDAVLAAIATVQSDTNDIQTRLPAALESGRIAAVLDSAATAALVDLIWDEPLTGATHNVATSSGKRLRQTTAFQQIDSTVIDASATTTTFVTGLTSSVDNFYNDSMLVFTDGALAGQVRAIYDYIGATKTIILEEALTSAPVNGVAFAVVSLHIHPVSQIQSGLATSATALSTTQWTNTLATDLGTTNTTVATNLNATVSSRSTQTSVDTIDDLLDTEMPALTASVAAEAVKTSAIKAKTDNLPTDPADQSLVEAAITAATSPLATPAQVNAEVVDVLSVDTFAELSAPPAATSSLKDKLTWLFMYARNKVTQTATTRTLYRDDTTTVAGTSGTSDNGTTFTKGEDA